MDKLQIKQGWVTDLICTVLIKMIKKSVGILVSLSIVELTIEQRDEEIFFDVHFKGHVKKEDVQTLVQKYIRG